MKPLPPTIWPRKRKRLTRPGAVLAAAMALGAGAGPLSSQAVRTEFTPPPITVPEGFEVTLAAAPPLVGYPMMACFDDVGRLYIAESDGRNLTTRKEIEKELPRFVRRLVDTDGDGVFDQSTIFADKMTMPEGGVWLNGALYIISAPYLWRLEDTDGDGVADKREKILGSMEFDGRANQHGPYLGPNGRLYFTGGHFGYQFEGSDGSKTGHSRAGGVFSCRPDGSDVRIDGQGPLNPVDVAFTRSGEMLSTCAIYDSFGGKRHDALIHWIHGGLTQRLYGVPLIPDTGARLPALSRWGQVAPCGLLRYRGASFGAGYRDTLFACQFNTHKVVHVRLQPSGATFTTEESDFLTSSSIDFHPADIVEDADGSLLLLDTGGWLSWGCPHSKTAKPEIKGAIYRIRRKGAKQIADPRGLKIAWNKLPSFEVANLLADPRPAVRDRARTLLISRGAPADQGVQTHLENNLDPHVRLRCVRVLSQIDSDLARTAVVSALGDKHPGVRALAARSVGELKIARAQDATAQLMFEDFENDPAVRRNAATSLGRIGDPRSAVRLFDALLPHCELFMRHAITLALIEIGDEQVTSIFLAPHATPVRQRTALRVLDQLDSKLLSSEVVVPLLTSPDSAVRDEARRVITKRPAWRDEIVAVFQGFLQEKELKEEPAQLLEAIVLSFTEDQAFHALIADALKNDAVPLRTRSLLLASLGFLDTLPPSLHPALHTAIDSSSASLKSDALALLVRQEDYKPFSAKVDALAKNGEEEERVRIAAFEAIVRHRRSLPAPDFKWLANRLRDPKLAPLLQRQAARVLSHLKLTSDNDEQAAALADLVAVAAPLHIAHLLEPFEQVAADRAAWPHDELDALGENLATALRKSPGRSALLPAQWVAFAELFTAETPGAHQAFRDLSAESRTSEKEREAGLNVLLQNTAGGNASRGRILFRSHRAACALCHRVDGQGGSLGPNLSKIGAIRSRKDLLEAIVYPSATVVNGFESYLLTDNAGNAHLGLVQRETEAAIYLRGADQRTQRLPRKHIKSITRSPVSAMPAGLAEVLSSEELADLLAFLEDCR